MGNEDLAWEGKIRKGEFEGKLVKKFGQENISKSLSQELNTDTECYETLTTYHYGEHEAHCATWHKGIGWIFTQEVIDKATEEVKHMEEIIAAREKKEV